MIVEIIFIIHSLVCRWFSNDSLFMVLSFVIECLFFYKAFEKIIGNLNYSKFKKFFMSTFLLSTVVIIFIMNTNLFIFSSFAMSCYSLIKNTFFIFLLCFYKKKDFQEKQIYTNQFVFWNTLDSICISGLLIFKIIFEILKMKNIDSLPFGISYVITSLIITENVITIIIKLHKDVWCALKSFRTQMLIISRSENDDFFSKSFEDKKIKDLIDLILNKSFWRRNGFEAIISEMGEVKKSLRSINKNNIYKEERFEIASHSLLKRMRRDADFSACPQSFINFFRKKRF